MENLEQQLIGSRKVREFLKHFSESQWSRVVKASIIMGIQELEKNNQVHNLSCQDLEDIVVSNEVTLQSEQSSCVQGPSQKALQLKRDRTNSLPLTQVQSAEYNSAAAGAAPHQNVPSRRGGRPTQGVMAPAGYQSATQRHHPAQAPQVVQGTLEAKRGSFTDRPVGIQVFARQPHHQQMTAAQIVDSTDNSIAEDLATFGDDPLPVRQPQRAQSVPRNLNRPSLIHQPSQPQYSYALPEEQPKQSKPKVPVVERPKPSSDWRQRKQPSYAKIGERQQPQLQRVRSEQARMLTTATKEQRTKDSGQPSTVESRRRRNLLPAQQSIAGQRAKSLNPLIYPSWWGDGGAETPAKAIRGTSQEAQVKSQKQLAIDQQYRTRNQDAIYTAEAYVDTYETEQTLQYGGDDGPLHAKGNSFRMAAQKQHKDSQPYIRQDQNADITQNSSTMSLADALHQAKATADRLQRDIDQSRAYRAHLLTGNEADEGHQTDQQQPMIVDIRNEAHIRQQQAVQRQGRQRSSSARPQQRVMRPSGQENMQRNGSQRNVAQVYNSGRGAGNVVLQHSPPRTTKTQQARQQYNSQQARETRMMQQNKRNTSSNGQIPSYLKNVTSRIRDQVQQDKRYTQTQPSQPIPVEIFVTQPPPQAQAQAQQTVSRGAENRPRGERPRGDHREGRRQNVQQVQVEGSYEDSYGRLVKLQYERSDMNQQYALHPDQAPHYQHQQQQQQQQQQQPQYIQDPRIINNQNSGGGYPPQPHSARHHHNPMQNANELCTDLLDSPYVQKFAQEGDPNHEQQQVHHEHMLTQQSSEETAGGNYEHRDPREGYSDTQQSSSQSQRQDDSTIQTHHLHGGMSNGAPPQQQYQQHPNQQRHMFSVENSSSMVMYNATVRQKGSSSNTKTDTSAAYNQHLLLSQGNQILFDSKAFDQMPSQLHQINSQTGMPSGHGRNPSSNQNNMTTLGNQPLSLEHPQLSQSSQNIPTDEKQYPNQGSTNDYYYGNDQNQFKSAGFGLPDEKPRDSDYHQQQQQQIQRPDRDNQQRLSDYQAPPAMRNQTGHQLDQMRRHPPTHNPKPAHLPETRHAQAHHAQPHRAQARHAEPYLAEPNHAELRHAEALQAEPRHAPGDHTAAVTEETKIMTFKSQDYRETFKQGNQTNIHEDRQGDTSQLGPDGAWDKRASANTLSQMTNPFRTKVYANGGGAQDGLSQQQTLMLMSQSDIARGQVYPGQAQQQHQLMSDSKLPDEFSSLEENKSLLHHQQQLQQQQLQMQQHAGAYPGGRQDTEGDPSSSSMSGYDLKGMLSRVRNQANYVQQQAQEVLKSDGINESLTQESNSKQPQNQAKASARYRHVHKITDFAQPSASNAHQFLSQQNPAEGVDGSHSPFTQQALSHVVSQHNQGVISARDGRSVVSRPQTHGGAGDGHEAPSSYHPVVSQDFNPLKTTIGNQDEELPNMSGFKSNGGQDQAHQMHLLSSSGGHAQARPQANQMHQVTTRAEAAKEVLQGKPSHRSSTDQNDTTMTHDLSDYSSSVQKSSHRSSHRGASGVPSGQEHLMMMPKQISDRAMQQMQAKPSAPVQMQNFMPPAQIHTEASGQQMSQSQSQSQQKLETRMQDFIASQSQLPQNSATQQQMVIQQLPKSLRPMTDTETSDDDDDDDLSSGSPISGTDTSGIDTSSMSQSLQSSIGVKGLVPPTGHQANMNMMTQGPTKNQYPAMAFNHPKYSAGAGSSTMRQGDSARGQQ